MSNPSVGPNWQHALVLMAGTLVCAVTIVLLYWAHSIFIPLALAAFLTFLLSPFVARLREWGVGRTPAVILIVCLAATGLGVGGWVVTVQISSLLRELPEHTQNIKDKVRSLKNLAVGSSRLSKMFVDINQELTGKPAPSQASETQAGDEPEQERDRPKTVVVEQHSPTWLSRIALFLSPLVEHLGQLALAMVLVIFMLQKREELRNRIIRLVGQGRLVAATRFVDEAGQRISRFLLMQAIVNGTFGLVLGFGLLCLGVKYALLWGFLGAMLRYLPYIGAFLAAVLPVSLTLAMTDGWGTTLLVIGLFVTLELIVANVVEPWLYGQSMGVSEIALLVSAAFFAFLWGPIGLVLSSPLTVCLVMLGRYFPQLEFLDVLLGDAPALEPNISFYQRLLARDQDEALDLILERMKTDPPDQVYDTMLVPALCGTKLSRGRGELTEADEYYILCSIREIVEELSELRSDSSPEGGKTGGQERAAPTSPPPPVVIFGCPARDAEDRVGLEMLQGLLDPRHWRMDLIAPETLTAELLELVAERKPALVCIAAMPPGGLAHTRYLCKRLRARFPELRITVGRWGEQKGAAQNTVNLQEAGALLVSATLLETRQQLATLLPVLQHIREHRVEAGPPAGKAALGAAPSHGIEGPRPTPKKGCGSQGRIPVS
jgi:predicted PurR-regulated permease PerM